MRAAFMLCLRDMRKHWLLHLLVIVQMSSCALYLMIVVERGAAAQAYGRYTQGLQGENIMIFRTNYDDTKSLRVTDALVEYLVQVLDEKRTAYAFIPLDIRVKGHFTTAIVGFGDTRAAGLAPGEGEAWLGRETKLFLPGDTITLAAGRDAVIEGHLPKGAVYMRGDQMEPLDGWLYAEASFKDMIEMAGRSAVGQELSRVALVNPSEEDVAAHMRAVATSEQITLRPVELNQVAAEIYLETQKGADFYKLIYGCVFLCAFASIVLNILLLIGRNVLEYAVHRLYGATVAHLLARSVFYIALLLLIPLLYVCLQMDILPSNMQMLPLVPWACVVYVVAVAVLAAVPFIKLRGHDFTRHLRGD